MRHRSKADARGFFAENFEAQDGDSAKTVEGLTESQLVMDAARTLPVEKRDVYLQRIAAMLALRGHGHFDDARSR